MAELKTKETAESVSAFLDKIADKTRRQDCLAVLDIMRDVTKEEPKNVGHEYCRLRALSLQV